MKKINLKSYKIQVSVRNENGIEKKEMDYDVKDSLVGVLMNPEVVKKLNIGGREALQVSKLASKLEDCKEEFILLEAGEYEKITRAADAFIGWGKFDGELLERIFEAETVAVEEKK